MSTLADEAGGAMPQIVIASTAGPAYFAEWDDLIAYMRDHRVVPIVGPDLVRVEYEGQPMTFDHYLALRLARELNLDLNLVPDSATLHDLVCIAIEKEKRAKLYMWIERFVREAGVATPDGSDSPPKPVFHAPEPLRQLAAILDFDVFVTTTLDSLLELAIDEVRFKGRARTTSIAYKPKGDAGGHGIPDLVEDRPAAGSAIVYHLFGKPTTAPEYVICDEDMLGFVSRLQQDSYQPQRLFDLMGASHLLLLGVSLPDWLARFFLHVTKARRPRHDSWQEEMLADTTMSRDVTLAFYLSHFSLSTKVFPGTAVEFVAELYRRWSATEHARKMHNAPVQPPREMPDNAIFLSYAREDSEAVFRLKERLEENDLVVWFDTERLEAGDRYSSKIRDNIDRCVAFVPVLSHNTTARPEGYFRREWGWASDRAVTVRDDWPFVVPVRIDSDGGRPERFRQFHMTDAPNGEPPDDLIRKLKDVVKRFGSETR